MDEGKERCAGKAGIGMKVYGLMAGPGGYFVGEGEVEGAWEGGFRVKYRYLVCTYKDADFGRIVFTDREKAYDAAEDKGDEEGRAAREDFAEQNTKPFGKV